jgi:hypothetical protein
MEPKNRFQGMNSEVVQTFSLALLIVIQLLLKNKSNLLIIKLFVSQFFLVQDESAQEFSFPFPHSLEQPIPQDPSLIAQANYLLFS